MAADPYNTTTGSYPGHIPFYCKLEKTPQSKHTQHSRKCPARDCAYMLTHLIGVAAIMAAYPYQTTTELFLRYIPSKCSLTKTPGTKHTQRSRECQARKCTCILTHLGVAVTPAAAPTKQRHDYISEYLLSECKLTKTLKSKTHTTFQKVSQNCTCILTHLIRVAATLAADPYKKQQQDDTSGCIPLQCKLTKVPFQKVSK